MAVGLVQAPDRHDEAGLDRDPWGEHLMDKAADWTVVVWVAATAEIGCHWRPIPSLMRLGDLGRQQTFDAGLFDHPTT